MNLDPLETRLQQLQPRVLPAHWRREILAAAEPGTRWPALGAWLPGRWPTLALGSAWLAIALLRVTTPADVQAPGPTISAAAFVQAQQEKERLLASIDALEKLSESPASSLTWPSLLEKRPL